jgi:hypothetical protein
MNEYYFSDTCKDCSLQMNSQDYFLVKNELWKAYSDHPRDMICLICFENRVGRTLLLSDFKEEKMSFTDDILRGKTAQEYRYSHYCLWKANAARKL